MNGWIVIVVGILAVSSLIGVAVKYDHDRDMEHIKQGHCLIALPGGHSARQWEKCK